MTADDIVDNADVIHIHDEWTRLKFDEGKYKSTEIYGTPRDPELKKEYEGIKSQIGDKEYKVAHILVVADRPGERPQRDARGAPRRLALWRR